MSGKLVVNYRKAPSTVAVWMITIASMAFFGIIIATSGSVVHAQDSQNATMNIVPVTENIYMLVGEQVGNIGVSAGDDGVFLIDDQIAPLTDEILNAVNEISDKPIKFVINTHWHPDHAGGNVELGKNGSIIVSHDNSRERLSTTQFQQFTNMTIEPLSKEGLPIITFDDSITFHFNGDEIRVEHVPSAHTDGDAIVHFTNSNVLHSGDIFSDQFYPFIDLTSNGSIDGIVNGVENTVLPLLNENSTIIPGHGNLTTTDKLVQYLDMVKDVRNQIAEMIGQGKTLDEVKSANPTQMYDEEYGQGFINSEAFIEQVYDSLKS